MNRVGLSCTILRSIGFLFALVFIFSTSTIPNVLSQDSGQFVRIESDDDRVEQNGVWTAQSSANASGGGYLFSSGSTDDVLTLDFYGTSIEIIYVGHSSFGSFAIEIDNDIRRTVVTTSDETTFDIRAVVDYLEEDFHTLRVYPVEGVIGIDVFITQLAPRQEREEAGTIWYVSPLGSDTDSCLSYTFACETISAAIGKASAGDIIEVRFGSYNEAIVIDKNLTFNGTYLQQTRPYLSGNGLSSSILTVNAGVTVTMNDFTFAQGDSGTEIDGFRVGGGIFNEGNLTLNTVKVQDNSVRGDDAVGIQGGNYTPAGGGIYNAPTGTLTLINSTVSDNESIGGHGGNFGVGGGGSAAFGGGIYNDGGILNLQNSTLDNNRAIGGDGGGLVDGTSGGGGGVGMGGGIFDNDGTLNVTDSTISNNIAQGGAGGPGVGSGISAQGFGGGGGNGGDGFEPNTLPSKIPGFGGGGGGGVDDNPSTMSGPGGGGGGRSTSDFPNTSFGGGNGGVYEEGESGISAGAGIFIYLSNKPTTILRTTITGNSLPAVNADARSYGGGIYSYGNVTISDSVISENTSAGGNSGGEANFSMAGGIMNSGKMSIDNSTISNNQTGLWSGGIHNTASLTIDDSIISGNMAGDHANTSGSGRGGGIWNDSFDHYRHDVTITNSIITDNHVINGSGGGIYNTGFLFAANSTITGNQADENGGGISNQDEANPSDNSLFLTNVTITNNLADADTNSSGAGGGLWMISGVLNLNNSIIAENEDHTGNNHDCLLEQNANSTYNIAGYNLIGDNTGCESVFPSGSPNGNNDFVGTNNNPIDPRIASLSQNGHHSVHPLFGDSPAIDAIPPSECTYLSSSENTAYNDGDPVTTDQRGTSRPDGTNCDIGAVEYTTATCDLSEIIQAASISSDGTFGNTDSFNVEMSADGRYITFDSATDTLVLNDTNNVSDVFVHDRLLCETTRVSLSSIGDQANNWSRRPDISDDGRYVVFESEATNLIGNDTNYWTDIYLYDRQTQQASRVSVSTTGDQGLGYSLYPAISGDGSTIVYQSEGPGLVPNDTNSTADVFLYNRSTGETSRISVTPNGSQADSGSGNVDISANGQFVVFYSYASNLVPEDTSHIPDIFVYDAVADEISRVNVSTDGNEANDWSLHPRISTDGNVVAFMSRATNLVTLDTNNAEDIFIHNRTTGVTSRVSLVSGGGQSNGHADYPDISGDGRYVVFYSEASNLVPNDTNGTFDVFLYDTQTGETSRLSKSAADVEGDNPSRYPTISANGAFAAFESDATNLVAGDVNARRDIFVRNLLTLEAPYNLTATPLSRTQIDLAWGDLSGENPTFHIERSPNGVDNWAEIGTTSTTTFSNTNLTCGTTYYYRVYGVGAVTSPMSNIAMATTLACAPNKPVLIAPLGSITNLTPTFIWNEAGDSTYYHLVLNRGSAIVLDTWYAKGTSSISCNGTSCSVTPNLSLSNGNYTWWINGWDPTNGNTQWSNGGAFSIQIPPPAAINKTAPTNGANLSSGNVTFTWDREPNATWYQLALNGVSTWYSAASVCNVSTCSINRTLSNGAYTWYVQGYGVGGNGSWGSPFTFTIQIPKPGIINKVAPIGTISTSIPAFEWQQDPSAIWYQVWIGNIDTTIHIEWYLASSVCNAGQCSIPSPNTYIGAYRWYIRGYGDGGEGPWGSPTEFSYTLSLNNPSGTVSGINITYQWSDAGSTTTYYHLWAGVNGGSTVVDQWVNATSCNDTTCSFTASGTIPNGNYIWYIQPYGPTYGNGSWSAPKAFSVSP